MGEPAGGADPLLGTEVGRFRLTKLLGKGGMGRVYLGVNEAIGLRVAIKILAEEHAERPELVERFYNEARAVARIEHEAIAAVSDLARLPNGRPCIVMEYVEGETLRQLVEAGPVAPAVAVPLMCDVLEGLDAAHTVGVVHRDLKPDNVIVTERGRAKILDFGIAKLTDAQTVRTATGVVLGTPHYMAPEQVSGKPCDARTDVYAAGTMLFELLTGERPFAGATDFELMEAHLRSRVPMAGVSPALDAVIARAMAKAPDDRFASTHAMAEALKAALVAPAGTRTPRWMIAAFAVVVVVAGFMVFVATRPPKRTVTTPVVVVDAPPIVVADAPVPDAEIVVDAEPVDAAVEVKAKVRDPAPTYTCSSPGECPRFNCTCKREALHVGTCRSGVCSRPLASCTEVCAESGGFTGVYYLVNPRTEADCRASTGCTKAGACRLLAGNVMQPDPECAQDCRQTSVCRNYGACGEPPASSNVCQALAEECAKFADCAENGYCGVRNNRCAQTDEGCAASQRCKSDGWCKLVNGSCAAE